VGRSATHRRDTGRFRSIVEPPIRFTTQRRELICALHRIAAVPVGFLAARGAVGLRRGSAVPECAASHRR
jgi:hypothetical protein